MDVEYCKADESDLPALQAFVDFWLSGGGIADGVPGSGHDFFVPMGRHEAYLKKYSVLLAKYKSEIVGWAVKTKKGVLIHLLVSGTFRGQGIGSELLQRMKPDVVRSKFDQSTGDPGPFYAKHGFHRQAGPRLGKKQNIDIFIAPADTKEQDAADCEKHDSSVCNDQIQSTSSSTQRQRTIDKMAERLGL